jgi:transposase
MHCARCGSTDYTKSGKVRGKQRYKCRDCGYHFTNTHGRGYPPEIRLQALRLYTENMGLRAIGRFLGIDPATVMHWVEDEGVKLLEQLRNRIPESLDGMDIIEIDEMWHYTQKNGAKSGFGLLYLETHDASSPLKWALAAVSPSKSSGRASST